MTIKREDFQKMVYDYYEKSGRDLPWRKTHDPYAILVSEVMLQQTQVERVVEKYIQWLAVFPTFEVLADAPLSAVLQQWSGLGYNRRAKYLHQLAQMVMEKYEGILPKSREALLQLPGIGTYTAASVQAFAFNLPVVVIDTNIRSIYIHYFFPKQDKVEDTDLIPLIEATMDIDCPNRWYNALMDFGVQLKKQVANPSRKSRHYSKQSSFKGSLRRIRGAILKYLVQTNELDMAKVADELNESEARVAEALSALEKEGLVSKTSDGYRLA